MSEPLELRVPVLIEKPGDLTTLNTLTAKQTELTKGLGDAIGRVRTAADDSAKAQAKNAADALKQHEAQQKAFEAQERAWRQMQGVHAQALRENTAANEKFGNSVQQWISNPLAMAGQAARNFALEYGKIGVIGLGVGAGLGVAAKMMYDLTRETGAYALQIRNISSRTGLGVESAQLMTRSAGVLGVDPGALTTGMRTLSQGLTDMSEGGKKARAALADLGITAGDALRPMDQLLPMIFEHLSQVKGAMDKDALAIALFGRGGLELLPLIEHFKEMSAQVTATGVVIDKEGIKRLIEYEERMRLVGLRWQAVKDELAVHAIATIEFVSDHSRLIQPTAMAFATGPYDAVMWAAHLFGQLGPNAPAAPGLPGRPDMSAAIGAYNRSAMTPEERTHEAYNAAVDSRNRLQTALQQGGGVGFTGPLGEQDVKPLLSAADARVKSTQDAWSLATGAAAAALAAEEKLTAARLRATETVTELTKHSQEMEAKAGAGTLTPMQRYSGQVAEIELQRTDALRLHRVGVGGVDQSPQINADFDAQIRARFLELSQEIVKAAREDRNRQAARGDELDVMEGEARSKRKNSYLNPAYGALDPRLNPQLPYATPLDEQIRRTEMGAGLAMSMAKRGTTGGVSARLSESMDDATAQAIYKLQTDHNAALLNGQELINANEKALNELIDRRYSNQIKAEEALAALREEQQKAFESKVVEGFHALTTGHGAQFGRSLLTGMGDKVIGNAAGMAFDKVSGMVPQITSGPLGALLKGTPFNTGLSNDPVAATKDNTTALEDSTTTMATLITTMGGPDIPGIPGYTGGMGGIGNPMGFGNATNPFGAFGLLNGIGGGGGTASANPIAALLGLGSSGTSSGTSSANPFAATLKSANTFGSSFVAGATNPFNQLFGGSLQTGPGKATTNLTTGVAGDMGAGVAIAGAGFGTYKGISQMTKGGAGNVAGGLGTTLMAIAPLTGPAAPFVMAAGMFADMFSAIFGDPKANRSNSIANQLQFSQFIAPQSANVSMDTSGHFSDTNFMGQQRSSNLSPYPVVQQQYYDLNNHIMVPGRTTSAFGAPTSAAAPPVIIQAMDSQSFKDWGTSHADALEHVMTNVVHRGGGNFVAATRSQLG